LVERFRLLKICEYREEERGEGEKGGGNIRLLSAKPHRSVGGEGVARKGRGKKMFCSSIRGGNDSNTDRCPERVQEEKNIKKKSIAARE